ncbi:MAG: LLM class F420-dependent oxidoreductase [Chloroflexi bacterium]|nr:LLM class F420-dependent oxidoreductase [Chloroflexota bacterium]
MRIGVVFPQYEIGSDPAAILDFAQAVERLGYSHLLTYEHVLGASTENRPDWHRPYGDTHRAYTDKDMFHEPLVLFGFLAAVTHRIELVTGILILPQRQTVLVAKQAAEVDVLCRGRLRLGVGMGWNPVEYEALGENFRNKASRIEEQISVLRSLWVQPCIDYTGQWHRIPEAGINPLPVQRPIPIWMGGGTDTVRDVVLERIARLADGWMTQMPPNEAASAAIAKLREYAQSAGRNPASLGIEARLNLRQVDRSAWRGSLEQWRDLGATHVTISSLAMGLSSPCAHVELLERIWSELGLSDFETGTA